MNLIFIIFDSLRKDCLEFLGQPPWGVVKTPNLNKIADLLSPPLTVVSQPAYDFGEVGVKTLIKKINGAKFYGQTISLMPKLIVRKSCKRIN